MGAAVAGAEIVKEFPLEFGPLPIVIADDEVDAVLRAAAEFRAGEHHSASLYPEGGGFSVPGDYMPFWPVVSKVLKELPEDPTRIVINVGPDCRYLEKTQANSRPIHRHESSAVLLTVTRNPRLTTQCEAPARRNDIHQLQSLVRLFDVRQPGAETEKAPAGLVLKHKAANQAYYLAPGTWHRTPPPAPGVRVHFAFIYGDGKH